MMKEQGMLTRRSANELVFSAVLLAPSHNLRAQVSPAAKVYKEATCGCCGIWARHLTAAGFAVTTVDVPNIEPIKAQLGIPYRLASCHTAEIGGYLIEGHVPASVIKRLLAEAPKVRGLAVPGMPVGSPGMEGGSPELYEVILFGPSGMSVYARCRGAQEI